MNAAYSSVRRVYVRYSTKQALNVGELRMYELRGTGLSRAQVNAGCRPNARASFGLPGSPEVIGGSKGFSSVKRRNGNNEPTCMTLTPILHPPPGSPERRAVPRRFVAFVNNVITLCAPTAATSRARFTYRCPATSARSSVPFPRAIAGDLTTVARV